MRLLPSVAMVYGIARMLNFAHGDVIMVGGYMSFMATTRFGWHPLLSVIFAVIICTVLGIVIEQLAYKPLRAAPYWLAHHGDWGQLSSAKRGASPLVCQS